MNKQAILQYLRYQGKVDDFTNHMIDQCIEEVRKFSYFKVTTLMLSLHHQPLYLEDIYLLLNSKDLEYYFKDCNQCLIIACTLGIQIDRRIKYYEHIDMTKAVIFDAVSSRYLEECCNDYEKSLNLGKHTFRFAPGYGDIPLELNIPLSKVLKIDKTIGVSINAGGLFIPMKSMLGIIGIGEDIKKNCLSCAQKENCKLRKGGQRCYVID